MKEENIKLKVGNTVVLKSGGPVMTIINFCDDGKAICTWYEPHEEPYQTAYIPTECLEEVEKEYIGCDGCELDCDKVDCDICEDIEEKIDEKSQYYNPIIGAVGKIKEYKDKDISDFCKEVAREAYRDGASWMYDELTK